MNPRFFLGALLLLSGAAPSHAGTVLGGSLSLSEYGYNNVEAGVGWQGFLGYHANDWPVMLEVSTFALGDHKVTDFFGRGEVSLQGEKVFVGFIPFRKPQIGVSTWVKAGGYLGRAKYKSGFFPDRSTSTEGGAAGVGGAWMFSRTFGLRVEYELLFDVKDLSASGKSTVGVSRVGVQMEFGGARVEQPEREPRPPAADF